MISGWKQRAVCAVCAMGWAAAVPAVADRFDSYALQGSFNLPAGASAFDVLNDGRVVALSGANIYVESAPGSRSFGLQGSLAGMDVPLFGSAFLKVSPDGSQFAVGNSGGSSFGNFEVGIFDSASLSGQWFLAGHFGATWLDDTHLVMTAGEFGSPAQVTILDTSSSDPSNPINPILIDNIGGSPAGITFDVAGNLYTGNGFDSDAAVGSNTGDIKVFDAASLAAVLDGGVALDFETQGALLGRLLSASALGFDDEGNLHVGGGDLFGSEDGNYVGLLRASALAGVLGGGDPVNVSDPTQVRRFDPDASNGQNFYDVVFNDVLGELYIREGATVYVLPEPSAGIMLWVFCAIACRHRRR